MSQEIETVLVLTEVLSEVKELLKSTPDDNIMVAAKSIACSNSISTENPALRARLVTMAAVLTAASIISDRALAKLGAGREEDEATNG